jgi:hypothetical protein
MAIWASLFDPRDLQGLSPGEMEALSSQLERTLYTDPAVHELLARSVNRTLDELGKTEIRAKVLGRKAQ